MDLVCGLPRARLACKARTGARYGPLPVWIDQIFLVFTQNLVFMLAARALLFASLTAAALDWLAKTLRLSPWFAVVTMLSPWIWLFARSLWDSTWCIPISALLLAAYARFLADSKPAALIAVVICCVTLPLVHLMGVAMVLPVFLHALLFRRAQFWAWRWRIGVALTLCLYLFWPYLFYSFTHIQPLVPPNGSALLGWLFPFLGGHFLTLGVAGTMPGGLAGLCPRISEIRGRICAMDFAWGGSRCLAWHGAGDTARLVDDPPAPIGKCHGPPLFHRRVRLDLPNSSGWIRARLFCAALLFGNMDRLFIFRLDRC